MRLLLLLVLAGCIDEEDDDCDTTRVGIDLQALDPIPYQYWLVPTAVGGVQHVGAHTYDECGTRQAASQVTATTGNPVVIDATVVATEEIELRARAVGETTLVVENQRGLRVEKTIEAHAIQAVNVTASEHGDTQAFYGGVATIELVDVNSKQLVDRNLDVIGDIRRAPQWNQLDLTGAVAGEHVLEIIAGTSTWPTTVRVVDGIDAVIAEHPTLATPYYLSADVCFFAERAGQMVAGVPWHFTVSSLDHGTSGEPNCIGVWGDPGTTVTVTATALGLQAVSHVSFTSM